MTYPIIDLHCDLLDYLGRDNKRTPYDSQARCSITQLQTGGVHLQVLAIYTKTNPYSVEQAANQLRCFKHLIQNPSFPTKLFKNELKTDELQVLLAFENASGFCTEDEQLTIGLKRLENICLNISTPVSISLTWNEENRFGGGSSTQIGLKSDGKALLEFLDQHGIAIDLSHTSDALAYDIIDYISNKNLTLRILATHSNARKIQNVSRNLPDEIAQEIIRRKGLIGLNLYHSFIGTSIDSILNHLMHWLELGGENSIALGADFFCSEDIFSEKNPICFFDSIANASTYPFLINFLEKELQLPSLNLQKFTYQNALKFIQDN